MSRTLPRAFTLVELLAAIAVIAALIGLLIPAVNKARDSAARTKCANNLKQLAVAMHAYHDVKRRLPYGAKRYDPHSTSGVSAWFNDHGWYSLMGPYIEQSANYALFDFNVPISDARNEAARRSPIPLYSCPADGGLRKNEWQSTNWARLRGNYVVNFGNTNYGQTTRTGVPFGGAPFALVKSARFGEIKDGVSNTMLMSEVITCTFEGTTWAGPVSDLMISAGGQTFTAWQPPNSAVFDDVARLCQPAGTLNGAPGCNRIGDIESVLLQSFAARSKHFGGVNASFCDGSVHWLGNDVDPALWRGLSTSRGDESLAEIP